MAVVASFLVVAGVPFVVAARLDAMRIRRLTRAALVASVPAVAVWLLYVPTYSLAEVGMPYLLLLIAWAWLFGFVVAPLFHHLWSFTGRFARCFP